MKVLKFRVLRLLKDVADLSVIKEEQQKIEEVLMTSEDYENVNPSGYDLDEENHIIYFRFKVDEKQA